jgi:hypothetical protein
VTRKQRKFRYPQFKKKRLNESFDLSAEEFDRDWDRVRIPKLGWVRMREYVRSAASSSEPPCRWRGNGGSSRCGSRLTANGPLHPSERFVALISKVGRWRRSQVITRRLTACVAPRPVSASSAVYRARALGHWVGSLESPPLSEPKSYASPGRDRPVALEGVRGSKRLRAGPDAPQAFGAQCSSQSACASPKNRKMLVGEGPGNQWSPPRMSAPGNGPLASARKLPSAP